MIVDENLGDVKRSVSCYDKKSIPLPITQRLIKERMYNHLNQYFTKNLTEFI